jgi:transcriptional regulator with XRE-family HTH domain
MTRFNERYKALVSSTEEQRLYQHERLLVEATELISRMMEAERISRSQLADRLGKSKAFVTQTLRGKKNMTLRTLADFAWAIGYSVQLTETNLRMEEFPRTAEKDLHSFTVLKAGCLQWQSAMFRLSPILNTTRNSEVAAAFEQAA